MPHEKLINSAKIILWVARIWGSLFLLFLLFMVGGHLIGSLFGSEDSNGEGFRSVSEMLQFILLFPVGTMIGLALALKWEGLGGFITTVAIISLFIIRPDLITNLYMVGIGICGLLYLAYWALTRNMQLETQVSGKEHRKTNRNNIVIASLISLVPLLAFIWSTILNGDKSYIITEKDSSYNKIVEQVEVIVNH